MVVIYAGGNGLIMPVLDDVFASNVKGVKEYLTIELSHSAFNPTVHRLVAGKDSITATLEATAPYNAGETVSFLNAVFDFSRPEGGVKGRQDLTCTIKGASVDIVEQLELQANANREPIMIRWRAFRSDDLSAPVGDVLSMPVINPKVKADTVTFTGEFADLINKQFPSIFYKTETHPGLV
jgi:hypothetical protein